MLSCYSISRLLVFSSSLSSSLLLRSLAGLVRRSAPHSLRGFEFDFRCASTGVRRILSRVVAVSSGLARFCSLVTRRVSGFYFASLGCAGRGSSAALLDP